MSQRPVRAMLSTLSTVMLALTLVVATPSPASAATPLRIMPLGDSITGGPGCWRALLWDRLQRNGFTSTDFVGTLPGGGCGLANWDGDNEGHGGFSATGIANANQLPGWLAATRPDIVLMHLGTNDIWGNTAAATILSAYATLVDQMRASNPSMKILVAQIIPMTPSGCTWCPPGVAALNSAIPAWAASKSTSQSPITVVDQFTGFDSVADTSDGVHPDDSGFQKMSDRWYPALTPLLGGTPPPVDTTPPSTPGTPTATATATTASLLWTASTDNISVTGYDIYRAPGASGGSFASVGTSGSASFIDAGLTAATTYRYQVRARDAGGNTSAFSAPVTVRTLSGGGGGCSASLTVQTAWGNGYVLQPNTVTNSGTSTLNGWTVTFTLPAGHTVTGSWNATVSVTGQTVTARGIAGQNATLGAGASTTWGMQASRPNGDTAVPAAAICSSS